MFYVYYLRSTNFSAQSLYIGFTRHLKQRFKEHNDGKSVYAASFKPWKIIGFFGFDIDIKALRFEQYLKTNAGRMFLRRYFCDQVKNI